MRFFFRTFSKNCQIIYGFYYYYAILPSFIKGKVVAYKMKRTIKEGKKLSDSLKNFHFIQVNKLQLFKLSNFSSNNAIAI